MNDSPLDQRWTDKDADWLEEQVERFEASWRAQRPLELSVLLAESESGLQRQRLARELVLIDLERRWMQTRPALADYAKRFPEILEDGLLPDELVRYESEVRQRYASTGRLVEEPSTIDAAYEGSTVDETSWCEELPVTVGRFQLVEQVGKGAFGAVFRAIDSELGRSVAVKIPHAGRRMSTDEKRRFIREVKMSAALRHPAIVAVHEAFTVGGIPMMVSDFVEGQTLAELIADNRLGHRRAAEVAAALAEAIEYAHQQGILHRDVKPGNVLMDAQGQPHLTDFGMARRELDDSEMTVDGQVLGTPAYMSPEQATGEVVSIGAPSDVYSAGAVLYELLTGRRAFQGEMQVVLKSVAEGNPTPPRQVDRSIPIDLETICQKAMRREPRERYQTAGELAADLRCFLRDDPIAARREPWPARARRTIRRHPALAGVAATVLVGLVALSLYWSTRPGRLTLVVEPAGAEILVDGRRFVARDGAMELKLPAGVYEVTASAPDHQPLTRVVHVARDQTQSLTLPLARETGTILAECYPAGAEMIVDGRRYGSRIPALEFPTGRHSIVAQGDYHFVRRWDVNLQRDVTVESRFWLDRGELWTVRAPWLQSGYFAVNSVNPAEDRVPDICHMSLSGLQFFSGVDGAILREFPIQRATAAFFTALPYDDSDELLVVGDPQQGGVVVYAFLRSDAREPLWQVRLNGVGDRLSLAQLISVPDLTGDGVAELMAYGNWSQIFLLNGSDGERLGAPLTLNRPAEVDIGAAASLATRGDRVVLTHSTRNPPTLFVSCIEWSDDGGKEVWTRTLPNVQQYGLENGPQRRIHLEWRTTPGCGLLDCESNDLLCDPESSHADNTAPDDYRFVSEGRLLRLRIDEDGKSATVRSWTGEALNWRFDAKVNFDQSPRSGRRLPQLRNGTLLMHGPEVLLGIDSRSGQVVWSFPHACEDCRVVDLGADELDEVLVMVPDRGLVCLDASGRELWTLRVPVMGSIASLLPDLDGDGQREILLKRHSSFLSVVREPRVLWKTHSVGSLQATPLPVTVGDQDAPQIVQLGPWRNEGSVAVFDGRTGTTNWSGTSVMPPNRAPAIADLGRGAGLQIIGAGRGVATTDHSLLLWDLANGTPSSVPCRLSKADSYCTPLVADFDGDGKPDVATPQYVTSSVCVYAGSPLRQLWSARLPAPILGGGATVDIDDDGVADLIMTCTDGYLYGIRGRDGHELWRRRVGVGLRGAVAIDRTQSSPRVLVVALQMPSDLAQQQVRLSSQLVVLDAGDGRVIERLEVSGASESYGAPRAVSSPLGNLIVAPLGVAGIAAWNADTMQLLWQQATRPVISAVTVVDIDGDQCWEAAAATADGRLLVLDLETGRPLWDIAVATQQFEADVALADLDQDDVLDFVLANYDFSLAAVSGRGVAAARRELQRLPGWLPSLQDDAPGKLIQTSR